MPISLPFSLRTLLLTGFFLLSALCHAQQKPDTIHFQLKPLRYDTNYIVNYRDKLCVTWVGSTKSLDMQVVNPGNTKMAIQYKPSTAYNWGFGLDYKWLSLELTTRLPLLPYIGLHRGKSEQWGFRFGSTGRKVWFTSFIQYYAGQYIENPQLIDPDWLRKKTYYPARPDIENLAIFLGANYAFNHRRYSHNAALSQIDQQKKSAGTFVLGGALMGYATQADSSVVPQALWQKFPSETQLTKSATVAFAITFGYVHTFVIKQRFFIHLGLIPGITVQASSATMADATTREYPSNYGGMAEARLSLGYNGKKYYGGLTSASMAFSGNTQNGGSVLTYNYSNLRLFFGRRFTLPFRVPVIDRKKPG